MKTFTFRTYNEETDFETVYNYHCDYAIKTAGYQLSGASPCATEEMFRESMARIEHRAIKFHIIADENDKPIGIMNLGQYWRIARHRSLNVILWENAELTEEVVRRALDMAFSFTLLRMVVCTVNGNDVRLLDACRNVGMQEVGCIPDYFCYEGEVYPEYKFIIKREDWIK